MASYAPDPSTRIPSDPNGFVLDATRIDGTALAADLGNFVESWATCNSGPTPPAFHVEGMLWYNTTNRRLHICTTVAVPALSRAAVWTPISSTPTAGEIDTSRYEHVFVDANHFLNETNDISNANSKVFTLDLRADVPTIAPIFVVNAVGNGGGEYFYISNDSGRDTTLYVNQAFRVRATGTLTTTVPLDLNDGDGLQNYDALPIGFGELWLIKSQTSTDGFGNTTRYLATKIRYAPANLQPASVVGVRELYSRVGTADEVSGLTAAGFLGFLAEPQYFALDPNGRSLKASGEVLFSSPAIVSDNSVLYIYSPTRILRIANLDGFGSDETSSFGVENVELTVGNIDGPRERFFIYQTLPLLAGVQFNFRITFEEIA